MLLSPLNAFWMQLRSFCLFVMKSFSNSLRHSLCITSLHYFCSVISLFVSSLLFVFSLRYNPDEKRYSSNTTRSELVTKVFCPCLLFPFYSLFFWLHLFTTNLSDIFDAPTAPYFCYANVVPRQSSAKRLKFLSLSNEVLSRSFFYSPYFGFISEQTTTLRLSPNSNLSCTMIVAFTVIVLYLNPRTEKAYTE